MAQDGLGRLLEKREKLLVEAQRIQLGHSLRSGD